MEQYRFENGTLFEYCADQKAYVFCFKHYAYTTKREAIAEYERVQNDY